MGTTKKTAKKKPVRKPAKAPEKKPINSTPGISKAAKIKALLELGFEPIPDRPDFYEMKYGEGTKNPQRVAVDVVHSQYQNKSAMLFSLRKLMEEARNATKMVQPLYKPKDLERMRKEGKA